MQLSFFELRYASMRERKNESFVSAVTHNIYDCDSTRLQYTYDAAGNIETVSSDSVLLSKYYYDGLNRLVREDDHTEGKTWVWCYNVGGNITEKRIYNLTTCWGSQRGMLSPLYFCIQKTTGGAGGYDYSS